MRVLFLASGNGGTMKFLHHAIKVLKLDAQIVGVISDRECGCVEYAINNGIPTNVFTHWKDETKEIIKEIAKYNPDIVVTNIYKILSSDIFLCGNATFINLHYSLLPAFGGVIGFKTLELAQIANTQIIGATCHYVTEDLDGGRVISQAAIPVNWNEDYYVIGNKVFRIACESILNGILIVSGMIVGESESNGVLYSPKLRYDNSEFSESFWDMISKL